MGKNVVLATYSRLGYQCDSRAAEQIPRFDKIFSPKYLRRVYSPRFRTAAVARDMEVEAVLSLWKQKRKNSTAST